jgi:hypothetical protein
LQEVGKFEKAFKDPEFVKLFADYAKEVSDPKVDVIHSWLCRPKCSH